MFGARKPEYNYPDCKHRYQETRRAKTAYQQAHRKGYCNNTFIKRMITSSHFYPSVINIIVKTEKSVTFFNKNTKNFDFYQFLTTSKVLTISLFGALVRRLTTIITIRLITNAGNNSYISNIVPDNTLNKVGSRCVKKNAYRCKKVYGKPQIRMLCRFAISKTLCEEIR